jgi:hypothetical protein
MIYTEKSTAVSLKLGSEKQYEGFPERTLSNRQLTHFVTHLLSQQYSYTLPHYYMTCQIK